MYAISHLTVTVREIGIVLNYSVTYLRVDDLWYVRVASFLLAA